MSLCNVANEKRNIPQSDGLYRSHQRRNPSLGQIWDMTTHGCNENQQNCVLNIEFLSLVIKTMATYNSIRDIKGTCISLLVTQ